MVVSVSYTSTSSYVSCHRSGGSSRIEGVQSLGGAKQRTLIGM